MAHNTPPSANGHIRIGKLHSLPEEVLALRSLNGASDHVKLTAAGRALVAALELGKGIGDPYVAETLHDVHAMQFNDKTMAYACRRLVESVLRKLERPRLKGTGSAAASQKQ